MFIDLLLVVCWLFFGAHGLPCCSCWCCCCAPRGSDARCECQSHATCGIFYQDAAEINAPAMPPPQVADPGDMDHSVGNRLVCATWAPVPFKWDPYKATRHE